MEIWAVEGMGQVRGDSRDSSGVFSRDIFFLILIFTFGGFLQENRE